MRGTIWSSEKSVQTLVASFQISFSPPRQRKPRARDAGWKTHRAKASAHQTMSHFTLEQTNCLVFAPSVVHQEDTRDAVVCMLMFSHVRSLSEPNLETRKQTRSISQQPRHCKNIGRRTQTNFFSRNAKEVHEFVHEVIGSTTNVQLRRAKQS